MIIPLTFLNEILETVRQNTGIVRTERDKRLKFIVPPVLSKHEAVHPYQEVVVYFDYREGWVLDTKEKAK